MKMSITEKCFLKSYKCSFPIFIMNSQSGSTYYSLFLIINEDSTHTHKKTSIFSNRIK